VLFGREFVDPLVRKLQRTGIELWLESQVVAAREEPKTLTVVSPDIGKVDITADAVVLACGAREMPLSQRGWLAGHRSARVFYTMQILELLDTENCLPMSHPTIAGSDLIAYSAAAKLENRGARDITLFDRSSRPEITLAERLYFRKWCKPEWHRVRDSFEISGHDGVEAVRLDGEKESLCDGVVISGRLIPNSELAVDVGLDVEMPSWQPVPGGRHQWSQPGWFVAGNMVGGLHGAEWCHSDGLRAAKAVAKYLNELSSPTSK